MGRLLIVSNRLPVKAVKKEDGLHFERSVGGLATGLGSFYKSYRSLWIGWPGIIREKAKKEEIKENLLSENCYPVFLSKHQIDNYYYGFSNKTIWPLFHYFPSYTVYSQDLWRAYKRVNQTFCQVITEIAKPDDIIWIHDYHLMLLPWLIREKLPEASVGFFLHIPFPSFEIFRLFPWRLEILRGLVGADLVGFHTYDYVQHFLDSVHRMLGYEHTLGQIIAGNRIVKTDTFPMGVDYKRFTVAVKNPEVRKEIDAIREKVKGSKIILSVDRLDYTKGILQRLESFDLFLEKNPEYKKKVTLILVAVPSRTRVEQYELLKEQLDKLIGRINGKYGTIDWMPIWYMYRSLPLHNLIALYNAADFTLATPLRDGMNLIAKEFIAAKTDGKGVLILSEMAGAAKELGEAITVNPNDREEIARALKKALTMPVKEQMERNRVLRERLRRYNVVKWAKDFMETLYSVKELQQEFYARKLTSKVKKKLIDDYSKATHRLMLLDYDGTLAPFTRKPEKVKPDNELLRMLSTLTQKQEDEVIIISGREKGTLEKWFCHLNMGLIAEHGVWTKEKEGPWETIKSLQSDWKEEIRPILEHYVDRTPGSRCEEKEFSLVWHYRKVDPQLIPVRAHELENTLLHFTTNLNLGVSRGNKILEVKNAGINKGQAALRWISKKRWNFILAAGDDLTDEDIFTILPEWAYSIKVGLGSSKAKFNIESPADIRSLLEELAKT